MAGPAGFPRLSARTPWRRVHSPLGLSGKLAFTASPHRFTDPLGVTRWARWAPGCRGAGPRPPLPSSAGRVSTASVPASLPARGAATRPDAPQECSEEVTSSADAVGASRPGPRAGPFRLEGSAGQQEGVAGPSATRSNGLADKICRLSF